jgi:TM2 domain-containing membrane protein YozV
LTAEYSDKHAENPNTKSPRLAAFLSFLFTGLGQIYNGEVGKGVAFFAAAVVLGWSLYATHFLTGIILFVFWIYNIWDAYGTAGTINEYASPLMRSDKKASIKSICRYLERRTGNPLGRLFFNGIDKVVFEPMSGTAGQHGYLVSSITSVESENDGRRMIMKVDSGDSYKYEYAGDEAVWGDPGLHAEEWQSAIANIKNPPPPTRGPISAEDPVNILKVRLAKGEITKEQYEETLKLITSEKDDKASA